MSYENEFKGRLDGLLKRAAAAGTNLSQLCADIGLARSTPDRWRKEVPKTIQAFSELELALKKREAGKVSTPQA